MGLLEGKRILVTGVLTDASLAFSVARSAQQEGAEVVLSGAGRGLSLTRRTARKLPVEANVLEIDVAEPAQLAAAAAQLADRWDRMDGLIHAIGYAPPECLGGDMFRANWEQVQVALHVSAYSLKALVEAFRPLLVAAGADEGPGASVVGLDFDATVAWPAYDWMGVSKAALESLSRYLARDLGPDRIRVNCVLPGWIMTERQVSLWLTPEADAERARAQCLKERIYPADVARLALWLAADDSRMCTNQTWTVDGGWT